MGLLGDLAVVGFQVFTDPMDEAIYATFRVLTDAGDQLTFRDFRLF